MAYRVFHRSIFAKNIPADLIAAAKIPQSTGSEGFDFLMETSQSLAVIRGLLDLSGFHNEFYIAGHAIGKPCKGLVSLARLLHGF